MLRIKLKIYGATYVYHLTFSMMYFNSTDSTWAEFFNFSNYQLRSKIMSRTSDGHIKENRISILSISRMYHFDIIDISRLFKDSWYWYSDNFHISIPHHQFDFNKWLYMHIQFIRVLYMILKWIFPILMKILFNF